MSEEELTVEPNYRDLVKKNYSWINVGVESEMMELKDSKKVLMYLKALKKWLII